MKIDHINISAPFELLEEVKEFYCNVFGLTEGFRPSSGRRGFWLYEGDSPLVHLSESQEHYRSERPGYLDHVAFQVTGLQAMQSKLDLLGVRWSHNHISELNISQLFFTDPAGLRLEANFVNESLS